MSASDGFDFRFLLGSVGGAALAVDAVTPNTTEPEPIRTCMLPGLEGAQSIMTLCSDAACTVTGWVFNPQTGKWFQMFSQALTAFVASQITNLPDGAKFYLRVAVNGGGATFVGFAIH